MKERGGQGGTGRGRERDRERWREREKLIVRKKFKVRKTEKPTEEGGGKEREEDEMLQCRDCGAEFCFKVGYIFICMYACMCAYI